MTSAPKVTQQLVNKANSSLASRPPAAAQTAAVQVPPHLVVTVEPPRKDTNATQLCVPHTLYCLPNESIPLLSVLGVIVAAVIAGRFAVRAAATQAKGAIDAAQEQSKAAIGAAANQAAAIIKSQTLSIDAMRAERNASRDRLIRVRRRRLRELLGLLGRDFRYLGTLPDEDYPTQTERHVAHLAEYLTDGDFLAELSDEQSKSLDLAFDKCKSSLDSIVHFRARLSALKGSDNGSRVLDQCKRQAIFALESLQKLAQALSFAEATADISSQIRLMGNPPPIPKEAVEQAIKRGLLPESANDNFF